MDVLLGGLPTVAVGTGMRPQEWSQLRWEHVTEAPDQQFYLVVEVHQTLPNEHEEKQSDGHELDEHKEDVAEGARLRERGGDLQDG